MQVVRAGESSTPEAVSAVTPMSATWLRGPTQDENLDVGLISFAPGAATPPHVHLVGQVLVVTAGAGFVEANGERIELSTGDIVLSPAGEQHIHGAGPHGPMTHLSVTTGRSYLPET